MTNEQLAVFISKDREGNKDLIPVLWKRVDKLLYTMANAFYRKHSDSCVRHGVELSDLRQGCYSVFLGALDAYKPESDARFTSYFKFQFQNMTSELLNIHTERGRQEPLNKSTSLDKEIALKDGSTATVADLIPDNSSLDVIDSILDKLDRETEASIVWNAVARLPERQQRIIYAHYYEDKPFQKIGEELNISTERVRQLKSYAIRTLRKNRQLRMLHAEHQQHTKWISVSRFQYSPAYFDICKQLREKPISYGKRQAIIYHAQREWESHQKLR